MLNGLVFLPMIGGFLIWLLLRRNAGVARWAVLAVAFVVGAVYSSLLVLRDAPVGPAGPGSGLGAVMPGPRRHGVVYVGPARVAAPPLGGGPPPRTPAFNCESFFMEVRPRALIELRETLFKVQVELLKFHRRALHPGHGQQDRLHDIFDDVGKQNPQGRERSRIPRDDYLGYS